MEQGISVTAKVEVSERRFWTRMSKILWEWTGTRWFLCLVVLKFRNSRINGDGKYPGHTDVRITGYCGVSHISEVLNM